MINWKVRLKNKTFWITFIPAVLSLIYLTLKLLGVTPHTTESEAESAILLIVTMLSSLGILNDPTTAGLSDSEQAMTYETPKEDNTGG